MKRLVVILLVAIAALIGWRMTRHEPIEVIPADQVNADTFRENR